MIYQLELPELTLNRLTDVVCIQISFLRYASSRNILGKQSCEKYFSKFQRFHGRHQQIVKWLWDKSRKAKLELLEEFSKGTIYDKCKWSKQLHKEAVAFLQNPVGDIKPNINKPASSWQNAGTKFLIKFYDDYLGNKRRKFPEYFFSEPEAVKFGREEFLSEFEILNQIEVCPACDAEKYSRIDHYLPKSLYPHLSCHPYNLVPICNTCNSDYKGETNLLINKSGNQRQIKDIFLPYRGYGLQHDTYLKINLEKGFKEPKIIGIKPQLGKNILERIEVFRDAFSIPDRWQKEMKTGKIQDSVLRQIRRCLEKDNSKTIDIFKLRNTIDILLKDFFEDQGKEANCYQMTWYLATLINKEIEPAVHSSALINLEEYALLKLKFPFDEKRNLCIVRLTEISSRSLLGTNHANSE